MKRALTTDRSGQVQLDDISDIRIKFNKKLSAKKNYLEISVMSLSNMLRLVILLSK